MKHLLLTICLLLGFLSDVKPQCAIYNLADNPGVKQSNLYVMVDDTSSAYAREIMRLIGEGWTTTPVIFLKGRTLPADLVRNGILVAAIQHFNHSLQWVRETISPLGNRSESRSEVVNNNCFYVDFFTIRKEYNPKWDLSDNAVQIARYELFLRTIGMGDVRYKSLDLCSPGLKDNS